jgi:hypothetical protein
MTAPIDDSRHSIDECIALHTAINIAVQLVDIIPAAFVIRLNCIYPVKESSCGKRQERAIVR